METGIAAYRAAILVISKAEAPAIANLGGSLQRNLGALELGAGLCQGRLLEIDRSVSDKLTEWGGRASGYFHQ